MKILLVTEQFPPLIGGGIVYFYNIFKNFSSDEVIVYTTKRKGANNFDRAQKLRIIKGWIWDKPFSLFHVSSLIGPIYLGIALFRCVLKEKIGIIHCGTISPFGGYGLFFKRLFGIPYVVHTFAEEIMILQRNRFKKKFISYLLINANKVIAISEFMKRELIKLGVKEENITIIPMCVDTNIFMPRDCEGLKQKLNLQDKKVILTVSRLVERKGHDAVIKSLPKILEKIPNSVYVIVGSGPTENKLKNLVKELALEKHVIFITELPHEATVDYYNICDLFIMPNRILEDTGEVEGFGVVFLEANACGKPVIGGRSGGAEEAIIDGSTGILIDSPTDLGEVSKSILRLLLDRELSCRMGEAGRKRARDFFNWNVMAKKLEELDKTIIKNRR
jgi:phosphatidylinositol alpha-1,6-mannosyltransferase